MGAESSRPWIVMVTGEPGSGKTSLGLQLATALRVPFLSRDHLRGGLRPDHARRHDPPAGRAGHGRAVDEPAARSSTTRGRVDAFVEIVETTARRGVTSVVEFVVTPQRVEALRRLEAAANCLVILAAARDAAARAERRDRADALLNRPDVLAALGHRSIDDYLGAPEREVVRATMHTEFDLPLLRVATDGGYDPQLDRIVDWVIDHTRD